MVIKVIKEIKEILGTAATVNVGTTTTGAPGSDAEVINTGTSSAAVFNFTIPRGDKGDKGDAGVGIQYKGVWDQAGTVPSPVIAGDLYAWVGASGVTLNNAGWGTINGSSVDSGDRLAYTSDNDWSIVPAPETQGVSEISTALLRSLLITPTLLTQSLVSTPVVTLRLVITLVFLLTMLVTLPCSRQSLTTPDVPVTSVNGKTGAVVLTHTDVGAAPIGHVGTGGTNTMRL